MKIEGGTKGPAVQEILRETPLSREEQTNEGSPARTKSSLERTREIFRTEIIDAEKLKEAQERIWEEIERLRKIVHIFDRRYNFLLHERTNRIFVQVIDVETDTIIREIPPEKLLNLLASIHHMVGVFFDERA